MKVKLTKEFSGANRRYAAGTIIDLPSRVALTLLEAGGAVSVSAAANAVAFDVGAPAFEKPPAVEKESGGDEIIEEPEDDAPPARTSRSGRKNRQF